MNKGSILFKGTQINSGCMGTIWEQFIYLQQNTNRIEK